MAKLQKWAPLWEQYPDYMYMPDSADVKKMIGGAVDVAWVTNTCAIRLSRTLNYNNYRVPSAFAGLDTVKGGDGKRYAYRVVGMRKWLEFEIGKPDFDHKKKAGVAFDNSQLSAMKGIIGFDIAFPDATGHLDLWTGSIFSSEPSLVKNYWTAATRISLWKAMD